MATSLKGGKLILMAIAVAGHLIYGIIISLHPPFFAVVAENKGATPSQYSFVFGIYSIAALLGSPLGGYLSKWVGPKAVYVGGDLLSCTCLALFALVGYIDQLFTFLTVSYILRFFQGMGFAAGVSAIFSILISAFPDRVSSVSASVEVLFGSGSVIGPMVGGLLYEAGGFYLPFVVVASVQLLQAILSIFFLPKNSSQEKEKESFKSDSPKVGDKGYLSNLNVLKHPTILIPLLGNVVSQSYLGMTFVSLESHMVHSINATQAQVSTVFSIDSLAYLSMQLIIAPLCDRMTHPTILSVICVPLLLLSLAFLGPSRLVPNAWSGTTFTSICLANALMNFSVGPSIVAAFKRAYDATARLGYNMEGHTLIVLSSFLIMTIELSTIFGSTLAGFCIEYLGYKDMTLVFMGLAALFFLIDLIYLANDVLQVRKAKRLTQEEEKTGRNLTIRKDISV